MFFGFDSGGSKTKLTVVDGDGNVVFEGVGGAGNLNANSEQAVFGVLQELTERSGVRPDAVRGVVIGAAGASSKKVNGVLGDMLARLYPSAMIDVVSDAVAAAYGGLGDREGVVVISGTGSIALAKNKEGVLTRVGGRGYLIGDEGSGYYIGRRVLSSVLRAYDGMGETTLLTELVCKFLCIDSPEGIIPAVYEQKLSPARCAPLCAEAYALGDGVAKAIIRDAAKELYLIYRSAREKSGVTDKLFVLMGGVGENVTCLRDELGAILVSDGVQISKPLADAAYGCAQAARKAVLRGN